MKKRFKPHKVFFSNKQDGLENLSEQEQQQLTGGHGAGDHTEYEWPDQWDEGTTPEQTPISEGESEAPLVQPMGWGDGEDGWEDWEEDEEGEDWEDNEDEDWEDDEEEEDWEDNEDEDWEDEDEDGDEDEDEDGEDDEDIIKLPPIDMPPLEDPEEDPDEDEDDEDEDWDDEDDEDEDWIGDGDEDEEDDPPTLPGEAFKNRFEVLAAMDSSAVFHAIGGKVLENHINDPLNFQNACALRISLALNQLGGDHLIPNYPNGLQTGSGDWNEDGVKEWYFYTAENAHEYLKDVYGNDDRNIDLDGDIGNIPPGAEGFIVYYGFDGQESGTTFNHIDYYDGDEVVGTDYSDQNPASMHFVRTN